MADELSRVETIFNAAVELSAPQERAAFLDRACGDDADLRRSVEALLAAHDGTENVLRLPYAQRTLEAPVLSEGPGTTIGRYKLLEQIGEGGFGVVFMAEQQQPVRRKVALKVIKLGMDTRQVIARFEAERQALALMDHENIARVLDAGATDSGRPYFVMELVHGMPITEYCDKNLLPPRERLDLFLEVCRAVQHAHQKGIIHRDIKPTNVLVTLHEGVAVPKVIDFGIAKATGQQLTEKTLFTNFAQMIGTPLYMSPEQAEMTSNDVDTRSDIYSLGVLLYELLTGTTPLDKDRLKQAAFDEIGRIIREEEPPRPSTRLSTMDELVRSLSATQRHSDPKSLGRLVHGDLDWIVMKALEKQRNRRYETANGLARDIERYLRDEAVEACPPSAAYRFKKFARRNRSALATGAIVFAVLVAGTFVSTWQAMRATHAVQQFKQSEAAAKESERVAIANAKTAQQQSIRADKYFVNARAVVDRMTERLNDPTLLQIAEVKALRKQLLEDLLDCYQKVFQDETVDIAGYQEKAAALRMIGDIRLMLGDPELAEKAYRDAIAMREAYVAQHPAQLQSNQVLATCYAKLGNLLAGKNRTAEAEAAYRRAIVLWSPLATDRGYDHAIYRESLRTYHHVLFNLLEHRGQSEAARAICSELLAPFEESAAKSREQIDLQLRLADALYWGGLLLKDTGRAEEGRKLHDRAIDLYAKLPTTMPSGPERDKMGFRYRINVGLLAERKRWAEVEDACRRELELTPKSSMAYNNVAWVLASYSDAKFSDPKLCVTLAKKAIELDPKNPACPNTLGVAYYRTGDSKAAIAAFEKSMEVRNGGDSADWFFLAMSNWQLGDRDAAHEWYDKAVAWMQKNKPSDMELILFRSEAAKLLGVKDPQTQPASSRPSAATHPAEGGDALSH